ncbi:hypothetical protein QBC45DRAFT_467230 [Copromyces sp. CBS 386.78]|nr:hypothetical protein QBC45DRAFT_467230 [Copromyces sp. CBS 386.78]
MNPGAEDDDIIGRGGSSGRCRYHDAADIRRGDFQINAGLSSASSSPDHRFINNMNIIYETLTAPHDATVRIIELKFDDALIYRRIHLSTTSCRCKHCINIKVWMSMGLARTLQQSRALIAYPTIRPPKVQTPTQPKNDKPLTSFFWLIKFLDLPHQPPPPPTTQTNLHCMAAAPTCTIHSVFDNLKGAEILAEILLPLLNSTRFHNLDSQNPITDSCGRSWAVVCDPGGF